MIKMLNYSNFVMTGMNFVYELAKGNFKKPRFFSYKRIYIVLFKINAFITL